MSYLQNFKFELAGPEDGPKLVFLHGVMGSAANWRKIIPAFEDKFRVLSFDQRGHGSSFKPKSGYAPEDYALDLKMILDELGWDKIILVGHSMGGRSALQFAQKFPQRLSALVIEDIGPEGNLAAMKKTIGMVEMVPVPFSSKAAAKEYFSNEFVEKLGGGVKARVLGQYFYTNIESQVDGPADWRFSKNAIISSLTEGHSRPRWDAVRDLRVPTLFIRGENSEEFPREEFERVLAINSKIKGAEIKGAAHWVHSEKSAAFIAALKEFFQQSLGF